MSARFCEENSGIVTPRRVSPFVSSAVYVPDLIANLVNKLDLCASKDRFRLSRSLAKIETRQRAKKPTDTDLNNLQKKLDASIDWVQKRLANIPEIIYPSTLPVAERADDIRELLANNQVLIVAGETGSGKTTQIPKICLSLGVGAKGVIGHTQPRRVAARSVASRIASELGTSLGALVGYQVRFTDKSSPNSLVKLMTDGILLSEIQRDRYLNNYECIIIDEAHERSLNIDFLLGYLKELLPLRPDLKLIVTSATIDVERFSNHFDGAPVIEVSGRTYPVEIQYSPVEESFDSLTDAVVGHVSEILDSKPVSSDAPDILVFFPGERDIREAASALRRAQFRNLDVLPLYSRLSVADQDRIFKVGRGRRVVLATNVAETSLTVPGIGYVIDTGLARISRYSVRTKVQRLPIEPISQASANQRAGRCGRIAEGVCIRLYSEQDYLGRPEFTAPEVLRTNLASVILQMMHLKLGDIRDFSFVEPPQEKQIRDGFQLLEELSFLDSEGRVTQVGRDIFGIPIEPRFARMLWQGRQDGCLSDIITLVSFMSVRDPRDRPPDKQQQADEKHRQFSDEESDFVAILKLWETYEKQRQALSNRDLDRWCKTNFISTMRLREWRDIHRQISLVVKERNWKLNTNSSSYKVVHRALLSGLLTHIGVQEEDKTFLGVRNRSFRIFPGSFLAKKPPKWIFAAQLLETSQLFAHQVAKVDPEWLVSLGKHLLQTDYYEPHYDPRRGEVMARQRFSLYGLVVSDHKKVSYKSIEPELCRELFIRECLVNWKYRSNAAFYQHNKSITDELEEMEDRTRSRDFQFDEDQFYEFYSERLPVSVVDISSFEEWRKESEKSKPRLLFLDKDALVDQSKSERLHEFPQLLEWEGLSFDLDYRFEPGHPADGVTLCVPIGVLHQVPEHLTEWLVPGMLPEKLICMLKALPKSVRRRLVPIPAYVEKMLPLLQAENAPLGDAVALQLKRLAGADVPTETFADMDIEPFYQMNYRLEDDAGECIAESRSLSKLKQEYRTKADDVVSEVRKDSQGFSDDRTWSFGDLPDSVDIQRGSTQVRLWPGLVDKQSVVGYELFNDAALSAYMHRNAVQRLLLLNCNDASKYLHKELFRANELEILTLNAESREALCDDLLVSVCRDLLDEFAAAKVIPRDQEAFENLVSEAKPRIVAMAMEREQYCLKLVPPLRALRTSLDTLGDTQHPAIQDMKSQIERLIAPGFLKESNLQVLSDIERYLHGIAKRIEKLQGQLGRDENHIATVHGFEKILVDWQAELAQEWQAQIPELQDFRWLLEEFRISLFSQPLKTRRPVSEKRLRKLIDIIETRRNALHLT